MSAHKEAAKQRKRKSLKMALEKCMQRRDAMACTEVAGGEQGGVMGMGGIGGGAGEMGETNTTTTTATAAAAAAAAAAATAAAAAGLLSFEHQEIAMQIKAAMAAEQQQRERAEAEAEAEAEAMDTTANTTANTTATTTSTTTATTTTTTGETSTTTDEGSDAEAEADLSGNEALPKATAMDIDEPESELVVVEPKIEPLSDSEPEDEEDDEQQQQQHHYAAAAVMPIDEPVEMQRTPTSTPTSQMLMMAHEAPALTSTPKVNVDVNEQ